MFLGFVCRRLLEIAVLVVPGRSAEREHAVGESQNLNTRYAGQIVTCIAVLVSVMLMVLVRPPKTPIATEPARHCAMAESIRILTTVQMVVTMLQTEAVQHHQSQGWLLKGRLGLHVTLIMTVVVWLPIVSRMGFPEVIALF